MYRRLVSSRALKLGLLVTLAFLALNACGGGAGGGEEQANEPRPLPEAEKTLPPGEYRTEEFKPSFSFRVGKGWAMETDPREGADVLEITWRKGTMNLFFMNVKDVYKLTKSGTSTMVQAPKDMVGWFQHHPNLQTVKQEPVTVGGVKGVQLDLVVEVPEDYYGQCGMGGCLDIAALGNFTETTGIPLAFEEGINERVIILEDVQGETVTIDFGASEAKFDEFAPEGQKVVESMKWIGS